MFYGIIVTAVLMALLFIVLKSVGRGIVKTPAFYITGVVLAFLLIIQTTLMIGAIKAKRTADEAQQYLAELVENYQGIVGTEGSRELLEVLKDEYPMLGNFIDITSFYGNSVAELPTAVHSSMTDYLNSYIWHRIWWIFGITIGACAIVCCFKKNNQSYTGNYYMDFERYTDS